MSYISFHDCVTKWNKPHIHTHIHTHIPDLFLNISREVVGSDELSSVSAVREDLISLLREGLETVLRRVSVLHNSPSLGTILYHTQTQ